MTGGGCGCSPSPISTTRARDPASTSRTSSGESQSSQVQLYQKAPPLRIFADVIGGGDVKKEEGIKRQSEGKIVTKRVNSVQMGKK